MNEVFLDTETTGLSFKDGHRVVEIACIETKDLIPTDRVFHKLINPQKKVSSEAFKVHGFSDDFLKEKEKFDEVVEDFLEFIALPETKERLVKNTQELMDRKGFGSPTFFLEKEDMYFGNDRIQLIEKKL